MTPHDIASRFREDPVATPHEIASRFREDPV